MRPDGPPQASDPRYPDTIKMRDIKTFPTCIGRNQLLVKVETDDRLYAWDELASPRASAPSKALSSPSERSCWARIR
jgi:hypothetical protein